MRHTLLANILLVALVACREPDDAPDSEPASDLDAAMHGALMDGSSSDTGLQSDAQRCGSEANPYARYCACEDAGGRFVVACSIAEDECFAYSSECTDEGFAICEATATGELRTLCEAFCDAHRTEDWAGGCGTLVDAG